MKKFTLLYAVVLVVFLVWFGFEIDPNRDWIAWLFIIVLPITIILLIAINRLRFVKKGEKDES